MQCNLSSVVGDKVEHLLWAAIVLIHLEGSLPTNFQENTNHSHSRHYSGARRLREGFKKTKWKFKMAFAMKGERGLACH